MIASTLVTPSKLPVSRPVSVMFATKNETRIGLTSTLRVFAGALDRFTGPIDAGYFRAGALSYPKCGAAKPAS